MSEDRLITLVHEFAGLVEKLLARADGIDDDTMRNLLGDHYEKFGSIKGTIRTVVRKILEMDKGYDKVCDWLKLINDQLRLAERGFQMGADSFVIDRIRKWMNERTENESGR